MDLDEPLIPCIYKCKPFDLVYNPDNKSCSKEDQAPPGICYTTPTTPNPEPTTTQTEPLTEPTTSKPTMPATTTPSCEPYEHPDFDPIRSCSIATETDISSGGACYPNSPYFWDNEDLSKQLYDIEGFNSINSHAYKHPLPLPDCWGYKRCMKFCPEIYPEKIHVCVFDCPCRNGKPMQFDNYRGGCIPKPISAKCDNALVHSHCGINPFRPT